MMMLDKETYAIIPYIAMLMMILVKKTLDSE